MKIILIILYFYFYVYTNDKKLMIKKKLKLQSLFLEKIWEKCTIKTANLLTIQRNDVSHYWNYCIIGTFIVLEFAL